MSASVSDDVLKSEKAIGKLALVGNPNVGKSVIFGMLTGQYVVVSNYPGTTVEVSRGHARVNGKPYEVIDTPGANSLIPRSEDERVARDILLDEKEVTVVQIADAKNLPRALFLTSQIAEMGLPQILVLNMWDETMDRGIEIDTDALSKEIGVPVVRTIATQRYGKRGLLGALSTPARAAIKLDFGSHIEGALLALEMLIPENGISKRSLGLMLLAGDSSIEEWLSHQDRSFDREAVAEIRARVQSSTSEPLSYLISLKRAEQTEAVADRYMRRSGMGRPSPLWLKNLFFFGIAPLLALGIGWKCANLFAEFAPKLNNVYFHGFGALVSFGLAMRHLFGREYARQSKLADVLGRIAMDPLAGAPVLIVVLWMIYVFVGVWGAGTCVDIIENTVFGGYHVPYGVTEPVITSSAAADGSTLITVTGPSVTSIDALELAVDEANLEAGNIVQIPGGISFNVPSTSALDGLDIAQGVYLEHGWLIPKISRLVRWIPSRFIYDLFLGQYGLISVGLTYSIAIVLPIVGFFFLAFGLLEDSGYLPRLSILADKTFKWMGLNGKAVLPMVLGLGCDTMATLTTRILDSKKERFIAVLLLALAVPCSAQLGVILGMLGGVSAGATLVFIGVITSQILLIGFLCGRFVPGGRSDFLLEIPPFRFPSIKNVTLKTLHRIRWFLKEAVPFFLLGTLFLFILDRIHVLGLIERFFEPVVVGWLGLPARATEAFIMGFLRRDYGAAGLLILTKRGLLDTQQIVVALTVITLFVPCIANFFVMMKEQGVRRAIMMMAFIFPFAILVGGLLNWILTVTGVFHGGLT